MGKQKGCDTLSPTDDATRVHLSEPRLLAGSELTILREQRKTCRLNPSKRAVS